MSFKTNSALGKLELLNEARDCCISCLQEVCKIPIRKVFEKRVVLQKVFPPFCRHLDKTQAIFGEIVGIFFGIECNCFFVRVNCLRKPDAQKTIRNVWAKGEKIIFLNFSGCAIAKSSNTRKASGSLYRGSKGKSFSGFFSDSIMVVI